MSAKNIRKAIEDICLDELGDGFKTHLRQFDIEGNPDNFLDAGVSVLWGDMSEAPARLDQFLSVGQDFVIQVTVKGFVNDSDARSVDKVDDTYASVNEILKRCVHDKLDQYSGVSEVRLRGVPAPKPFNVNQRDVVKFEISLTVYYLIA